MVPIVESGKKYWLALIAGVIAGLLTYLVMPVLNPILVRDGLFNSWASIKGPPSGAARILGASDGAYKQYDDIWIETQDGQIFSASVCTGFSQPCTTLPQWKSASDEPVYSVDYSSGTDCKKLGDFPFNPKGEIVECRYYVFRQDDLTTEIYYALMADGSLKYFVLDFTVQLRVLLKFALATALLFFIMTLFVFRLISLSTKEIQKKKMPGVLRDK